MNEQQEPRKEQELQEAAEAEREAMAPSAVPEDPPRQADTANAQAQQAAPAPPQGGQTPAGQLPPPVPPGGRGYHPPPGTYPSPAAPPVYTGPYPGTPVPPPEKPKRVGNITMALCLIALGVLLVLHVFMPDLDYVTIARLSPVVLELLGLELLVAAARHKGKQVRLSVLSVLLSLVLIGGSMVAAVVPDLVYRQLESGRIDRRLALELNQESVAMMSDLNGLNIANVEWYVSVQGGAIKSDMTIADLRPEHYVQARVHMPGQYNGPVDFARACRRVADVLMEMVPSISYASFYGYYEGEDAYSHTYDERYALWIESSFQFGRSADELAEQVNVERWLEEEGYYVSVWEYENRLANPEQYGLADPEQEDEPDADDWDESDEPAIDDIVDDVIDDLDVVDPAVSSSLAA